MASENQIVQSILRENDFMLRRNLVLSKTVLDKMRDAGVISDVVKRKIMLEPSFKQVDTLLHHLEYKGLASLRKFLDVLRRTGHGWLVELILDTDVTAKPQQRRLSKDDIGHRDGIQPSFTRPHPHGSFDRPSNGGQGLNPYRQSLTAGVLPPSYGPEHEDGLSLAELLRAREQPNDEYQPRGIINARTFLAEPTGAPGLVAPYPAQGGGPIPYPRSRDDIPLTLYGLNQTFAQQDQKHQHAMSVLRQEEMAIRQLMEQNARDQGHVRRKQAAVKDITNRLRDIHIRANEVYEPSPHPNIGRYRLAQLNQIPWSIDN